MKTAIWARESRDVVRVVSLDEEIEAPVEEGQRLGEATFTLEGRLLAEVPILAEKAVKRMDFATAFFLIFRWLMR